MNQRQKDIEAFYTHAKDTNQHPCEDFADGAAYGRKEVALRLRKLVHEADQDPSYDDLPLLLELAYLIDELERGE